MGPRDIFNDLSAERILDVATGSGGFIHFLIEGLKEYSEITGVDNNERAAAGFAEAFKDNPKIHFRKMDAAALEFADESFDLVCISNSLHHLDPQPVLQEMLRVLRPGGTLLISEMVRDNQTETQMTHVLLHHWWAEVDRLNGILHRETCTRQELLDLASPLGLMEVWVHDFSELEENPHDPRILEELEPVFERYIQRAEGNPGLQARGLELKQRMEQVGFHSATTVVIKGRKTLVG
jgi:SAM-dependent methyltransferase